MDGEIREPANKEAAMLLSRGTEFKPSFALGWRHSLTPLPIRKLNFSTKNNIHYENLVGMKSGRMTVVGLSAEQKGRWVVRCSCGAYELRKAKTIKNHNQKDRCLSCQQTTMTKRSEFQKKNNP